MRSHKNNAKELDELLTLLKPTILDFIDKADRTSANFEPNSLGNYHTPSYLKSQFSDDIHCGIEGDNEKILDVIDRVLKYSVNTWHPGFLDKLYASNNAIGVISDIILSILNTNSHVYTVSPALSVIENFIGKQYAQLFYNNDTCGGLTFSGGSWSNITSMQIARSMKFPDTKELGNQNHNFAIYTSQHCHYSVVKSAQLLGLGAKNVFKIDVNEDGTMVYEDLSKVISETKSKGYTPLYINATAGTTVFGSFDNFHQISEIAKKHDVWFHIDGSWGGNVIFSEIHKQKLKGCELSDSITVNPHKMLGVPNTCSFLLLPDVQLFQKSMSLSAPYLFHGREDDEFENFDLADGTMGCGRRADAFKFYLSWLYFGTKGFESRINHAYDIVNYFVRQISKLPNFKVIHDPQCLQVCFYYKPEYYQGDYTGVTRYISRELHSAGKYLIDFSPNPSGDNQEFFRVVFNSPSLDTEFVDELIKDIIKVGDSLVRDE